MPTPAQQAELQQERAAFRRELPPEVEDLWARYPGRIAVVLSGGGARGAYEAGVLLAFQDAKLPTHIIAATSVGSINAASYAAHSESCVGNAEHLVKSWSDLSPPAVGIDWFRYILVLGGLTAMTAGFGNLLREWLNEQDVFVHLNSPKLTWFALGLTGLVFLLFHDHASYFVWAILNWRRQRDWRPDRAKLVKSVIGNLLVWTCFTIVLALSHIHLAALEIFYIDTFTGYMIAAALILVLALGFFFRATISRYSQRFLRLPLRTGLFPNFERTRYLRERIPVQQLHRSPICLVMTAADVITGSEQCFTNRPVVELLQDPGADPAFLRRELKTVDDMMMAVIASSAFPIVYETVPLDGGVWTDGGIVSNQPIRPAIRLGADMLFLVLVEPRSQRGREISTFLDLGVRAIDILMSQNLKTDLRILNNVNSLCSHFAEGLGLRPEQVELDVGTRKYRYLKAITVEPSAPMAATVLDFDGDITFPAITLGYRDGMRAVHDFAEYVRELPRGLTRQAVRLEAIRARSSA
jgi:predicted acylesterase/phospholipase RssA